MLWISDHFANTFALIGILTHSHIGVVATVTFVVCPWVTIGCVCHTALWRCWAVCSILVAVLVGSAWYTSSAVLSPIGNTGFLTEYADPLAHILVRFLGASILGLTLNAMDKGGFPIRQLPDLMQQLFLPAICMAVANYSNSVAVAASGVPFAHIVKASSPFWTVLLCTLLKGDSYPISIYLSLLPTVGGVVIASGSDVSFTWLGMTAAVVSVVAQTVMAIIGKERIKLTGLSSWRAFAVTTTVCTLLVVPLQLLSMATAGDSERRSPFAECWAMESLLPLRLFGMAALGFFLEFALQFAFVALVSPLTFSVADIGRRIGVIATGTFLFGKAMDGTSVMGIAIAVLGISCYTALCKSTMPVQVPPPHKGPEQQKQQEKKQH